MVTPMQLDMNISVGNILTAAGMLAAIFVYLVRKDKRTDMQFLALHNRMEIMEKVHVDIAHDLKKLGDVFIIMARYDQQILNVSDRLGRAEKQIDELRHGKGLIQ